MNKVRLTLGIVLTVIGTLMTALGFALLTVFAISNPLSGIGMYRGFAAGILIVAAGIMMIVCDNAYGFTPQNICIVVVLALAIALAAVGKDNPYRSNVGYFAALSELIAIVYSIISRDKTSEQEISDNKDDDKKSAEKHRFKKLGENQSVEEKHAERQVEPEDVSANSEESFSQKVEDESAKNVSTVDDSVEDK